MRKSLSKVLLLLSAVIILAGTVSNVSHAESGHHGRGKTITARHAPCYQNGSCSQDGSCDVNGVCQNGGYCFIRPCIQSGNHSTNGTTYSETLYYQGTGDSIRVSNPSEISCTHDSSCVLHNGSCPDLVCTHNSNCTLHNGSCPDLVCSHDSNCALHNGSCPEAPCYQDDSRSGHHSERGHRSGHHN